MAGEARGQVFVTRIIENVRATSDPVPTPITPVTSQTTIRNSGSYRKRRRPPASSSSVGFDFEPVADLDRVSPPVPSFFGRGAKSSPTSYVDLVAAKRAMEAAEAARGVPRADDDAPQHSKDTQTTGELLGKATDFTAGSPKEGKSADVDYPQNDLDAVAREEEAPLPTSHSEPTQPNLDTQQTMPSHKALVKNEPAQVMAVETEEQPTSDMDETVLLVEPMSDPVRAPITDTKKAQEADCAVVTPISFAEKKDEHVLPAAAISSGEAREGRNLFKKTVAYDRRTVATVPRISWEAPNEVPEESEKQELKRVMHENGTSA